MIKKLVLLGMVSATVLFADNVVKNPDFAEFKDGKPVSWKIADDPVVQVNDASCPGGSAMKTTVSKKTNSQGQIIQFIYNIDPDKLYEFKGSLKGTVPSVGFYQIKLFKNKKEIKRISSSRSKNDWSEVAVRLPAIGADKIGILCRTERSKDRYVGESASFANIVLQTYEPIPLKIDEVTATPNLHSIGIVITTEGDFTKDSKCSVKYRKVGDTKWLDTFRAEKITDEKLFRLSLLNVEADTEYEITVSIDGKAALFVKSKTWPVNPPVGKVIKLANQKLGAEPLLIDYKGTADAWIKIVPENGAEGSILGGTNTVECAVDINNAEYVWIEGFKIRGGKKYGVVVHNSHDIMISNCDIAEWGETGTLVGKDYVDEKGKAFSVMGGIRVTSKASQIRMERNYIHDPVVIALSWEFGHPNGPTGISLSNNDGNNLIYNNQIIGSEKHWWNDGIEGQYNSYVTGGPNCDTDIEANNIAFCNDDGMEIDGGQKNVRVGYNYILWAFCGISCAPNRGGPSYLYRNVILLDDERGGANFAFKLGGKKYMPQGITYLLNNTVSSHGETLMPNNYGKGGTPIYSRNNIYHMGTVYFNADDLGDFDYDLYPVNGFMYEKVKPEANGLDGNPSFVNYKEGDFRLKASSLGVDAGTITALPGVFEGKAPDMGAFEQGTDNSLSSPYGVVSIQPKISNVESVTTIKVKFGKSAGETWKAFPNIDWISCVPSNGICDGRVTDVKITVDASKISQGRHRAAIIFRSNTGEGNTAFFKTYKPIEEPIVVDYDISDCTYSGYLNGTSDIVGDYLYVTNGTPLQSAKISFDVEVPETGIYQIWGRVLVEGPNIITHDSTFLSIDGAEPQRWNFIWRTPNYWQWVPYGERALIEVELTKGKHNLTVLSRENNVRLNAIRIVNGTPAYEEAVLEE
jgi:hypothetical protein